MPVNPSEKPSIDSELLAKKQPGRSGLFSERLKAGLIVLLAVFGLALAWRTSSQSAGKDFYQFWVVGQSLNRPDANIYAGNFCRQTGEEFFQKAKKTGNEQLIAVAKYRRTLQNFSSPFLYAMFRWFSAGHHETDLRNYRILMLAGLVFGIIVISRLLNYSWIMGVGVVAILPVWFNPVASDLYVGNVNCLQLAALAAYLWTVTRMPWRYRDFAGGILLSLMMVFKPNLAFVAVALAVHWVIGGHFRRLRLHALGGVAGAAFAIFSTAASYHSLHCWSDWLSALHTLVNDGIPVNQGNFSPVQIIYELFHINIELPLVIVLTGLTVALLWNRKLEATEKSGDAAPEPSREIFVVALGCLLSIIASRLTWFHYYVLTIPAFLFLFQPPVAGAFDMSFICRQILIILAFISLTPLPAMAGSLFAYQQAVLAASAALLLFLSLTVLTRMPKQQPATVVSQSSTA